MIPYIVTDSARQLIHVYTTVFDLTLRLVELKFRTNNIKWITKAEHTLTLTMSDGNQLLLTYTDMSDEKIRLSFTSERLELLRLRYDITVSDLCPTSIDCYA